MPRAPGDRRTFVEYELEARTNNGSDTAKKKVTRQSERTWNRLNAAERNTFIAELRNMKAARQRAERFRRKAIQKGIKANDTMNALPDQVGARKWWRILSACLAAAEAYNGLQALLQASIGEIQRFRDTVHRIHPNRAVQRYTDDLLTAEWQRRNHARDSAANFQHHADQPAVPPRGDGRLKFMERWIPGLERDNRVSGHDNPRGALAEQRRRTKLQAVLDEKEYLDAGWVGAWPIGNPGMSTTTLWLGFDDSGSYVTDRIVRKDTFKTRKEWADGTFFDGDIHDANNRLPFEISCHEALQSAPSSSSAYAVNVPEIRAYHVEDELCCYTLYLEYCDLGDLDDVIAVHIEIETPIPEPFLWRTFHSLAVAGLAMERGHTDRETTEKTEAWREIVHRDLKPHNVLLSNTSNLDFFASYPTPKLSDFGLAIKTSVEDDALNPEIFLEQSCTPGFIAPEQRAYVDLTTMEPVDRFKFSSKTNVWGLGIIMLGLATLNYPAQPDWLGEGNEPWQNHRVREAYEYSVELRDLINACLAFDPARRTDFATILEEIEKAIAEDVTSGRRDGPRDDPTLNEDDNLLYPEDRYQLGFARAELPERPES